MEKLPPINNPNTQIQLEMPMKNEGESIKKFYAILEQIYEIRNNIIKEKENLEKNYNLIKTDPREFIEQNSNMKILKPIV